VLGCIEVLNEQIVHVRAAGLALSFAGGFGDCLYLESVRIFYQNLFEDYPSSLIVRHIAIAHINQPHLHYLRQSALRSPPQILEALFDIIVLAVLCRGV
jgi:hypothetical protein